MSERDIRLYGIRMKAGNVVQSVSSLMRRPAREELGEECIEVEVAPKGTTEALRKCLDRIHSDECHKWCMPECVEASKILGERHWLRC